MYTAGEFVFYRRSDGCLVPRIRSFHARWKAHYNPVKRDSPLWCSFVNVVNCGKGEGAHAPAHRTGKFLLQYRAAHNHTQEPTFGPRSNLGGKWCGRTAPWFRGPTLLVLGHGGGGGEGISKHPPSLPLQGARHTPTVSGSPIKGGQNQKWLPHPCLPAGPEEGGNAFSPLHSWGSPHKGGQNQKWGPHPCLFRGPKDSQNAILALHSRGSLNKRGPNQKWLPHARLLGARKRAEMLRHPCILGAPNKGGQNRNRMPHPCRLGAQKRAEMLSHSCFLGDPQTKTDKIRSACLTAAF